MNNIIQKFRLHYYLKDDVHVMNDFVINKAESIFLKQLKKYCYMVVAEKLIVEKNIND